MVEIRKANINDLKEIQMLNHKLFEKEKKEFDSTLDCSWPLGEEGTQYFKDRIEKNGLALIAEDEGKIIGYLVGAKTEIESYREKNSIAELENMVVLEEYRSKGIGTKLTNEFLNWAKNFDIIKVKASAQNKKGINFYRKLGFLDYDITLEKRK